MILLVRSLLAILIGSQATGASSPTPLQTCLRSKPATVCLIESFQKSGADLSPEQRRLLDLARRFETVQKGEHDAPVGTNSDEEESSISLLLAFRLRLLEAAQKLGVGNLNDLGMLSAEQSQALTRELNSELKNLVDNPVATRTTALVFSRKCDAEIARVFGNLGTVAAGCGFEHGRKSIRKDGTPLFRFHLYSSAHIYSDLHGSRKTAPIYIPPGWKSASAGKDTTNASYAFEYPRLGHLTGVTLNVVHLDSPILSARQAAAQTNPAGSVRVGNSGGPGGDDLAYLLEGNLNYAHSHLQMFKSGSRVTFVEAFCSDTKILSEASSGPARASPSPEIE